MTPVKYGMALAGYAQGALLNILSDDGTVMVATSGCEVGQGLNTKVVQAVAFGLGVPIENITIGSTSTDKIPNFGETGGSGTSESCVQAVINACKILQDSLAPVRETLPSGYTWNQLISTAFSQGVNLSATAFFDPTQNDNGYEFSYFVYGAACSVVELDVLTGETEILSTDIVYDGGISLNPVIDIGQVEGAFVQGIGFFFTEDTITDSKTGRIINNGTWDYKPPGALDIPIQFNVTFLKNTPNQANMAVLSSKASGEPPYMLAASAFFALKNAIRAARADIKDDSDFILDSPATVEKIQLACKVDISQLTLSP